MADEQTWNPWAWMAEATGFDSHDLHEAFSEGGYAIVSLRTLRRLGWQGSCGDRHCSCWVPGEVCEEFMGRPEAADIAKCPRCGWSKGHHDAP